ncbi:MAG: hypothetical protein RRA15_06310 [bacterium]|nr:hypothetical protein [bacterium]MDT8366088.1 hypothetical protein [bacterium]
MSNPKYLLELKSGAERALNAEPPDGLTAFPLSWALWEAIRRRILVLACKREGWTVEQARDVLMEERIDNGRFIELFSGITMGDVWEESLPLEALQLWPEILKAVDLRKRIIHGTSHIGEESLQRTDWNVLRFVNRLHEHPLGDPLKKMPKKTKKTLSDESLRERIKK